MLKLNGTRSFRTGGDVLDRAGEARPTCNLSSGPLQTPILALTAATGALKRGGEGWQKASFAGGPEGNGVWRTFEPQFPRDLVVFRS